MDTISEEFQSLYVHFPFCETKCHYCDFFSLPEGQIKADERGRVYEAILSDLARHQSNLASTLETVFLGGGTPSLVPPCVMEKLFESLPLNSASEITIEANPSSITSEKASFWRSLGINRVSMGVQALEDTRLKWLGRIHSKKEIFEALEALCSGGFTNISIDYIVGVPGQSPETIETELREVLTRFAGINHVSAYLLTLKASNGRFRELPPEEEQLTHLRTVARWLKSEGFEQYEISNFARNGARARHNENYWMGGAYLGIGPSAHSYWASRKLRTKNWASLGKYADLVLGGQTPVEWDETLTTEQRRLEYLMLNLRRSEGVDLEQYRRLFGRDLRSERGSLLQVFEKQGLCLLHGSSSMNSRLQLTTDGFFLSDQILSKIS